MSDYYAMLKIQQGRLRAAMAAVGVTTAAELSRMSGISQSDIGRLLNFRMSAKRPNGEWRTATVAVCRVLGCDPKAIFPNHLLREIACNEMVGYVEQSQLEGAQIAQLSPSDE